MKFTLLLFTDGRRECFERTMDSAYHMLGFDRFAQRVIIDDSADTHYWRTVARLATVHDFRVVKHLSRRGFAGAIRSGWASVAPDADFVFHLEDDFTFNEPVELERMAGLLEWHPELVQVALLRQPWNDEERAAGGIMQKDPADYTQVEEEGRDTWVRQRRFFTTNPSLYRAELTRVREWPEVEHSEGIFTHRLRDDEPNAYFALWGRLDDPPRVTHIGAERVGTGY